MKDNIFSFLIGLLVGAIITASGFLIYQNIHKTNNKMPEERPMQMMNEPDDQNQTKDQKNKIDKNQSKMKNFKHTIKQARR